MLWRCIVMATVISWLAVSADEWCRIIPLVFGYAPGFMLGLFLAVLG